MHIEIFKYSDGCHMVIACFALQFSQLLLEKFVSTMEMKTQMYSRDSCKAKCEQIVIVLCDTHRITTVRALLPYFPFLPRLHRNAFLINVN